MGVLHVGQTDFERIIRENSLVLVDFWATWCGPCRMVAPVIGKIAEKYEGKVAVVKIDIDEATELAAQYEIQSIPTVILFKDGNPVKKEVGVKPQNTYEKMIVQNL